MLEAMKAMTRHSVMERLVLFANHVIAAEPAAVARLGQHAGKSLRLELADWPPLLPPLGPFAFRITPAGLLEEAGSGDAAAAADADAPADLRVAIAAANPAALLGRWAAGERPPVTVSGDAAFASDIDWLIDNLRWDAAGDLARFVGDGPARELSRLGGFLAAAFRDAAKAMRDLASRGAGARPPPR